MQKIAAFVSKDIENSECIFSCFIKLQKFLRRRIYTENGPLRVMQSYDL